MSTAAARRCGHAAAVESPRHYRRTVVAAAQSSRHPAQGLRATGSAANAAAVPAETLTENCKLYGVSALQQQLVYKQSYDDVHDIHNIYYMVVNGV